MPVCATCGGELEKKDFNYCRDLEFCPQCETSKIVKSKLYLNGKEVEFCVEVDTRTGASRILSRSEEDPGGAT